jgi:hypothetical protein
MSDVFTASITYANHRLVASGKRPFCVLDAVERGPSRGECIVTGRDFQNAMKFEDGTPAIFASESVARAIAEKLNGDAG